MVSSTRATLQVMSTFIGTFREKIRPGPEKYKNVPKQPNLKVIIHAFGLPLGPSSERHDMPPRVMVGHRKGVIWLETNILDAFMFISRQF